MNCTSCQQDVKEIQFIKLMTSKDHILCQCHGIDQQTIRQLMLNDISSLQQVIELTAASSNCGGCYDELEAYVKIVRTEVRELKQGQPRLPL